MCLGMSCNISSSAVRSTRERPGRASPWSLYRCRGVLPRQPANSLPLYFWDELQSQSRIGFIFQKLSEPRSFDFQDTRNKKYTARLQMPQFPLSPAQREAVITFVLGLVSDPPTEKFAYPPDERTEALLDGNEVLSKFQCRGCHLVEPESWQLAFPADTYGEQLRQTTYPFVSPPSR